MLSLKISLTDPSYDPCARHQGDAVRAFQQQVCGINMGILRLQMFCWLASILWDLWRSTWSWVSLWTLISLQWRSVLLLMRLCEHLFRLLSLFAPIAGQLKRWFLLLQSAPTSAACNKADWKEALEHMVHKRLDITRRQAVFSLRMVSSLVLFTKYSLLVLAYETYRSPVSY